jgi:hypothetical protein
MFEVPARHDLPEHDPLGLHQGQAETLAPTVAPTAPTPYAVTNILEENASLWPIRSN